MLPLRLLPTVAFSGGIVVAKQRECDGDKNLFLGTVNRLISLNIFKIAIFKIATFCLQRSLH